MPDSQGQAGPVALYGATGYTGRLVARELATRGADFVLSGRSAEKLRALAGSLQTGPPDASPEVRPASLDDPSALGSMLEGCAAVINCAGPFTLHGEPVLRAAVAAGVHYLDTTGEQPYMKMAFERYGRAAERAGVAVIPAMGFDYVPGDMIASLTAAGMGELEELSLAYATPGFEPSRGTTLSTLEILRGGDVAWRHGAWAPADQSVGRGSFEFPAPIGRQHMARYPAGEQITVPMHIPTRGVRTTISASSLAPAPLARFFGLIARPASIAMRTPARRAMAVLVSRLPEGPGEERRRAARFMIVCDARGASGARRGVITGSDVYGLTAAAVSEGALIAASPGFDGRGALAPAQAFDPESFLASLQRFDVRWRVEGATRPGRVPA